MERYKVLDMIGEGSFGRVYKGRLRFSGHIVAMKFISKSGRGEKEINSLKRELNIMKGRVSEKVGRFLGLLIARTQK